jgi:hypothetical protein
MKFEAIHGSTDICAIIRSRTPADAQKILDAALNASYELGVHEAMMLGASDDLLMKVANTVYKETKELPSGGCSSPYKTAFSKKELQAIIKRCKHDS